MMGMQQSSGERTKAIFGIDEICSAKAAAPPLHRGGIIMIALKTASK
jgi:hypothetical protein